MLILCSSICCNTCTKRGTVVYTQCSQRRTRATPSRSALQGRHQTQLWNKSQRTLRRGVRLAGSSHALHPKHPHPCHTHSYTLPPHTHPPPLAHHLSRTYHCLELCTLFCRESVCFGYDRDNVHLCCNRGAGHRGGASDKHTTIQLSTTALNTNTNTHTTLHCSSQLGGRGGREGGWTRETSAEIQESLRAVEECQLSPLCGELCT